MPILSKDSNEFSSGSSHSVVQQLQNTFIGAGNNSTRQPPTLRAGLSKGYEYNMRDASYGKLPQIDTNNFKVSQIVIPATAVTTTSQSSKYHHNPASSSIAIPVSSTSTEQD